MKPFTFIILNLLLLLNFGCHLDEVDLHFSGPSYNFSFEDQFNAIQGNAIQGNILDNDEMHTSYEIKDLSIRSAQGFTIPIQPTGHFSFTYPPEFTGRDTFHYFLLTLDEGEKKFEDYTQVFLSIIDAEKAGYIEDPRDGRQYGTILLDDGKIWMSDNLSFAMEGSSAYEDKPANDAMFGRLYSWTAAQDACLEGWHLPSREEAKTIFDLNKIPVTSNYGMWDLNYHAHFEGGFSGLDLIAGGMREKDGAYFGIGESGGYWTGSPGEDPSEAYYYEVVSNGSHLLPRDTSLFYSCRCVKDID